MRQTPISEIHYANLNFGHYVHLRSELEAIAALEHVVFHGLQALAPNGSISAEIVSCGPSITTTGYTLRMLAYDARAQHVATLFRKQFDRLTEELPEQTMLAYK